MRPGRISPETFGSPIQTSHRFTHTLLRVALTVGVPSFFVQLVPLLAACCVTKQVRPSVLVYVLCHSLPRDFNISRITILAALADTLSQKHNLKLVSISWKIVHASVALTSLSVQWGLRTRASLCFVSVLKRPRSVDSASVNFPFTLISRYVIPDCRALTRKRSLFLRAADGEEPLWGAFSYLEASSSCSSSSSS